MQSPDRRGARPASLRSSRGGGYAARLMASEATGQEVTILGEHDDESAPAYAALPAEASRGMVVLHEIFGRQPEIDRVVERFARAGYAAIAPDLFHEGRVPCLRRALRSVASGEGVPIRQVQQARRYLTEKAGVPSKKIGVIGFCFGGAFALAVGRHFGAVSTNYGDIPPQEVLYGCSPVLGCYGGRDVLFRGKGDLLRQRLEPIGVPVEVQVFPSAGHAFLTDGHHPVASALTWPLLHVRYEPQVAEEAWAKIMDFFARTL